MATASDILHGTRKGYLKQKCRCERCIAAGQAYAREWYRKNAERRKTQVAEWRKANKDTLRTIPDDKHGTVSGYTYWKCRCDRCRQANREAKRRYIGAKPHPADEDIPHGTRNKYRRGCCCRECRTALREYGREQYRRNPASKLASNARWMAANAERHRRYLAGYLAREEQVAKRRERRLRIRGVTVEPVNRTTVWKRDGGICYLCGEPADPRAWHLEHKIPIVLGGQHSYANVAVSHPLCNLRKGKRAHDGPAYGLCGGSAQD